MILIALALLAADPSSLKAVVASAKPGDTVKLVAGSYPQFTIKNRSFNPPLTIDATAATMAGITLTQVSGVTWTGGTFEGRATGLFGFASDHSDHVTIQGATFHNYLRNAVNFGPEVNDSKISGNAVSRSGADGFDVAMSHRVTIDHNVCTEFSTTDGSHPDCIQLWSRPTDPPVSDIVITGNSMIGAMQGISLFNHVRDGVDDGGFDRITITNNSILNNSANGIAVYDCRGCTVRSNTVNSLPNYLNRAQLYVSGGSVNVCGNTVVMVPRQAGPACGS